MEKLRSESLIARQKTNGPFRTLCRRQREAGLGSCSAPRTEDVARNKGRGFNGCMTFKKTSPPPTSQTGSGHQRVQMSWVCCCIMALVFHANRYMPSACGRGRFTVPNNEMTITGIRLCRSNLVKDGLVQRRPAASGAPSLIFFDNNPEDVVKDESRTFEEEEEEKEDKRQQEHKQQ